MNVNHGLPLVAPKVTPILEPSFRPAVLAHRAFCQAVRASGQPVSVAIALDRGGGSVSRFATEVLPASHPQAAANFVYLERWIKFLLWSRGAGRIYFAGPPELARQLNAYFHEAPTGKFDAELMGAKVYDLAFEVRHVASAAALPPAHEPGAALGRHLEGCRIGFDLGASDRKVAAVVDGEPVFTEEVKWDPKNQKDPQYHFDQINDSLQRAAAHLPRVDAIGGSAAGIYINNQPKVGSLFRGVPPDLFKTRIRNLFFDLKKAWNNIPFEVANDGEVTALAGSMAIGGNGVLGIAMGSSEAAGYVTMAGNITPWLNELAFVPVAYEPTAAVDEWSGDYGCGVQYFSQQAVGRLLAVAGIELDAKLGLPEKLEAVQALMAKGDYRAAKIYETIGTWFAYAVAHYAEFYEFQTLLILGRVTSGSGGELILEGTRKGLDAEFPELSARIKFHVPGEKEKRHGQAVAAASLPMIPER